jgi:hypothetical protein
VHGKVTDAREMMDQWLRALTTFGDPHDAAVARSTGCGVLNHGGGNSTATSVTASIIAPSGSPPPGAASAITVSDRRRLES